MDISINSICHKQYFSNFSTSVLLMPKRWSLIFSPFTHFTSFFYEPEISLMFPVLFFKPHINFMTFSIVYFCVLIWRRFLWNLKQNESSSIFMYGYESIIWEAWYKKIAQFVRASSLSITFCLLSTHIQRVDPCHFKFIFCNFLWPFWPASSFMVHLFLVACGVPRAGTHASFVLWQVPRV